MEPEYFGPEQVTEEDRTYRGSRFAEVRDAIFTNPYQKVWGVEGEPALPIYAVTLAGVLHGAVRPSRPYLFRQAVARAVDSHADLRWGVDHKGFRRIIHPNGICLTGLWEISEPTRYSGYFRQESRALLIARYSTCCGETRRGRTRSLSMVGKLFPTTDPNHGEPLHTASFITQQDLGGDDTRYINDAELRNAPNTSIWRRGLGAPVLAIEGLLFGQTDKEPTARQLYQIAELGKPNDEPTQGTGIHASHRRSRSAENLGRGIRFSRRNHGADLRSGRPYPETHAYLSHRGNRSRLDARSRFFSAAYIRKLGTHRQAGV